MRAELTSVPIPEAPAAADPACDTGRRVPFATTEIVPDAQAAALRVLRSGWVTTGPETELFERDLAEWLDVPHVVAVASCTVALEIGLRALRLAEGAAVLTPSLTFCGAVQAIVRAGLRPVLVDVDAHTLVPTPATVQAAADRAGRPGAMVVQHMAGYPVAVAELAAAADLTADLVVEDAAHGLGGELHGRMLGTLSRAGCLSFYATKNLPIGEGGAICTWDEELAGWARSARLHGMSHDAWRRYLPGGSWRYDVEMPGFKANLTDLQSAIGREQLRRLTRWQHRRAELAARYDEQLAPIPGIATPVRPVGGRHAWHLYQIQVLDEYPLSRDETVAALSERGVGTSVHFIPVHQLTYFRDVLGPLEAASVPVTDAVADRVLSLPMHPALADDDVDYVCRLLREFASPTGS